MGLGGCGPHRAVTPARPHYAGEVYLLRGLFNVWSTGMDEIGKKLQARGVKGEVLPGPEWLILGEHILSRRQKLSHQDPLVLVGHSYGADDAVRLARFLEGKNVTVDALVLVDPTTPPTIPANVKRCFNLFKSRPSTDWMPWFRGIAVHVKNRKTQLLNYDLRLHDPTGRYANLDHFKIDNNPDVHGIVIREILRSLTPRRG